MFKDLQLQIIKALQSIGNPFLDGLFEFITFFGESLLVIVVIGFFYWVYDKKFGTRLITVMLSSMVFNCALKGVIQEPRPFQDDSSVINKRPETATGYSFPSGHSQTASTLYTSLMLYFKNNWFKILMPILIILVMLSRLYLGAHYPQDVIVGAILGILFAVFLPKLLAKHDDLRWLLLILIMMFSPFFVLYLVRQEPLNFDFFKIYGLLIGFYLAYIYEKKYVNFDTDIKTSKKVLRFVVGVVIVALTQGGLKYLFGVIFPDPNFVLKSFLYLIRYGCISFVAIALYPHLFKKLKF